MARSPRRPLQRLVQKHKTACGIACIAMLTGTRYSAVMKNAEEILHDDFGYKSNFRTTASQLRQLAVASDVHLSRKIPFRNIRRTKLEFFELCMMDRRPSCHAIVAVNPNADRTTWHWVLWDHERHRILDPKDPPYKMVAPFYDLKITL